MRAFKRMVLGLSLAALMSAPALAQRGGGFGGGMMASPGALLSNKGVQKELKLTDEQVTKADDLVADTRERQQEAFQKLQDVPQEERREKAMESMRSINADLKKAMADILKPEQMKRFGEIELQARGADALSDSEVQQKLKLTDDQKSKLEGIRSDQMAKMRELFQGGPGGDREAMVQKMTDLRKETNDKSMNVLTSEQKATWKELTGEPYTVQFERRRPN